MRPAELLALAACALAAGPALAHGVHDLRGGLRFEAERLIIEIESSPDHAGEELCLRLLNELRVQAADGERLIGTEVEDSRTGSCFLDYTLPQEPETLTLRLQPVGRGPRRNERLILVPPGEAGIAVRPLVLSSRGNTIRLGVPR